MGGHKGAIEIWNVQSYVTQPSLGGVLGVRELQGRLRGTNYLGLHYSTAGRLVKEGYLKISKLKT
jgi:hypothetical protein